jgi:hypothetical protein
MPDTGAALREASDALLKDLGALADLEEVKRVIEPGDPRLVELAGSIEELAQRVLTSSARQRALSMEANTEVALGLPDAPSRPIQETPRAISAILAEWREAERRAQAAAADSDEAAEAERDVDRLKAEYRRAHDEAIRHTDD